MQVVACKTLVFGTQGLMGARVMPHEMAVLEAAVCTSVMHPHVVGSGCWELGVLRLHALGKGRERDCLGGRCDVM